MGDLAARIDAAVAKWKARLAAKGWRAHPEGGARGSAPEDRAAQIAQLRRELAEAEKDAAALRRRVEEEAALVDDLEARAMEAVRTGRDDLARDALARLSPHVGEIEAIREELEVLTAMCEAYGNALTELERQA